MAEQEVLFEINIDSNKVIKDIAESQKRVKGLKEEIKRLAEAEIAAQSPNQTG